MKKLWITWERHQRTRTLCDHFDISLYELTYSGSYFIRCIILSFRTIAVLLTARNSVVFVQNPSIVLSSLCCLLKGLLGFRLVVDRHSSFKLSSRNSSSLTYKLFHILSDYTLRKADYTIVTNKPLAMFVESMGGTALTLPDKLPELNVESKPGDYYVFVSSMADDEPIEEVIEAFRLLPGVKLKITGNYLKAIKRGELYLCDLPGNVELTGFVSDEEYKELVGLCKSMIVITDLEFTLTCGSYEAVSLGKPIISGNTRTIKNYFSKGVVYSNINVSGLVEAVQLMEKEYDKYFQDIIEFKPYLQQQWKVQAESLISIIK